MKQLSCSALGGPADCHDMISGNSFDEMVANGMKHLEEKHPDMAAKMKTVSKEEMDKWSADAKAKWDAAPEMPAEEKMAA